MITKPLSGKKIDLSLFDKEINTQTGDSVGQIYGNPYWVGDDGNLYIDTDSLTQSESDTVDQLISDHGGKDPYIKLSWTGASVSTDPDDGMAEMSADGVNTATLNIEKYDSVPDPDSAMTSASDNDSFAICLRTGQANPSDGRVQLSNGTATITFTPDTAQKGIHTVEIVPIDNNMTIQSIKIRFV